MSMKPVGSLEQYKALVKAVKQQFPGIRTNNIQLNAAMAPYIGGGRLFYKEYEKGLVFYLDEGQWYELTYFWDPAGAPVSFRQDKPVIAGEYYRGGTSRAAENFLEQAGFRKYRTNLQVEILLNTGEGTEEAVKAEHEKRIRRMKDQGFTFQLCEDDVLIEQILGLWDGYLELGDVPQDHRTRHPEDRILCVFDREKLAGVNWWSNSKNSSEGRHTVTHPDYYHRGIASAMLGLWCRDAAKAGAKKAFTWINETNVRSLGLYRKAGFCENGRKSIQYIVY